MSDKTTYFEVIEEEDKLLRQRRAKIMGEESAKALADNRFGIALSGGGIRSATINLGILKTMGVIWWFHCAGCIFVSRL